MKSICTIAIAVLLSTGAWAQPIGYQGKTFIISAGLGLGSNLPYYSGYVPLQTIQRRPEKILHSGETYSTCSD